MKLCPKCKKQFSDDANFCPVDAARLVPMEGQPEATDVDPLTQRFQLGPALGGARTGAVHQAVDKQTGAAAVVKIISPDVVALPGASQRIERELKQLERVQSVGVARVLASGRRGEDWWVATDLIEGGQTLEQAITARGPIPLEQAAHLIEVIGEALIEAAQVGVVHRDLAPKNVLFAGSDIKLINFSVPVPAERTPGVPEFVAPEQVEGKAVDQRSNLYSLGALYYYVLTGQPVHAGSPEEVHRAHGSDAIRPPSSITEVPAAVEAVILRALDKSPTKRFLTVRQFVDEVGRVARGGDGSVKSTQPMGKAGRPKAELVQTLLGVRGGMFSQAIEAASTAAKAASAMAAGGGSGGVAAPGAAAAPSAPVPAPFVVPGSLPAIIVEPQSQPHPASTMPGVGSSAGIQLPVEAPPMGAPVAAAQQERSPWASPGAGASAAAAVAAAPPAAAAAPAQPQPQAPAQPQPQIARAATQQPAGKSAGATGSRKKLKADKDERSGKGKFRETLWFKKGDLDAQAAAEAAEARARTGRDTGAERADSLPMDERYKDDGSVSRGDKEKYSLRTGGTEAMMSLRDRDPRSSAEVSEDELIGELKAGRGKVLALIGVAVIVLIVIVVVFVVL